MDVALATCLVLPEADPDAQPLASALEAAGVRARSLAWDDPAADFGAARLTLLRSTWNYPSQPDAFLAWAERTARVTTLVNALDVVRWNLHKRYLLELESRGVPIVPTEVVPRGSDEPLASVIARRGFSRGVVVKPAVSAASYRTSRAMPGEEAEGEAHLRALVAERDALVQPYLASIERGPGERSIVWIDGAVTHRVHKQPRFSGEHESVAASGSEPTAEERALAERAVAAAPPGLLYARVDVVPDEQGALAVMELELLEPSLYFTASTAALDRYVAAVTRLLRS